MSTHIVLDIEMSGQVQIVEAAMEKKIHPISDAVRELRTALCETQQQFAYRMGTAIRTISRWETLQPPHGKTLDEMAALAEGVGRLDLATQFQRARIAEATVDPFTHGGGALRLRRCADGSQAGYLVQWLDSDEQREFGYRFYLAINGLADEKYGEQYRQALNEFTKRVEEI